MVKTKYVFRQLPVDDHRMYRLRHDVFVKYGYLSADESGVDIDQYDGDSVHFGVEDVESNDLIGTLRLIQSSNGFPIEKEFLVVRPCLNKEPNLHFVEVSRLAIKEKECNGLQRMVMLGLIKRAIEYSLESSCVLWYLSADSRLFRLLASYGFAFSPLGEPKFFMGSMTVPAYVDIRAGIDYLKYANPKLYNFFTGGPADDFSWYVGA